MTNISKLGGYEFYRTVLNSAKHVVAPMVDQSELAWRMLCRKHGAHLCYTPMLHAQIFSTDSLYRENNFQTNPQDRPLIAQFCANDAEILLKAAKMVEAECDAVDINLGCPQHIARRGKYGAFLQDEWELIEQMVSTLHHHLKIPVTCKIRIFKDLQRTIQYAQMLERAGCQLLTVHGRTRDQKGSLTGLADWEAIRAIKASVSIPVFANGNILTLPDIDRCLRETGVDGVMSAEGNLNNPYLFQGEYPFIWHAGAEYLDYAVKYDAQLSAVRAHMFKILKPSLHLFTEIREQMATAKSIQEFYGFVEDIKQRVHQLEEAKEDLGRAHSRFPDATLIPFWRVQPYIRHASSISQDGFPPIPQSVKRNFDTLEDSCKDEEKENVELQKIQAIRLQKKINREKQRQMQREMRKKIPLCEKCSLPKGLKCIFNYCRVCCKQFCRESIKDCEGHKIFIKKSIAYDENLSCK